MQYRYHNEPGCGGCLFLVILLILVTGGFPLLFDILGALAVTGLFLVCLVIAGFWGFSYYIRRQVASYERSQTEVHNRFVFLLVNILVKIAALDGEISRSELNTIYDFFRRHLYYSQNQMYWVKELVKEATQTSLSLDELLSEFKAGFAYEPRLILLELVYQVIYSKPEVTGAELDVAERIALYLDINPYDRQAIHGKYVAGRQAAAVSDEQYYRLLGLEPGASFEEVKKAYRRMSVQYHPDKVAHLGEEFRKVAEEKMKELNVAYQHLKKKLGG